MAALGQAFDEAWGTIESNFCGDLRDIEKARYRLATALLSVASDDSRDVELLKRSALEAMALAYREDQQERRRAHGTVANHLTKLVVSVCNYGDER